MLLPTKKFQIWNLIIIGGECPKTHNMPAGMIRPILRGLKDKESGALSDNPGTSATKKLIVHWTVFPRDYEVWDLR